jgi:hypothetical protein
MWVERSQASAFSISGEAARACAESMKAPARITQDTTLSMETPLGLQTDPGRPPDENCLSRLEYQMEVTIF